VKGFLKSYAQTVGLVPADVVARYAASRRIGAQDVNPLPVSSPVHAAREGQSRRFGVAIALVLLLILFTLALSIVLKPRGRDMPPELSLIPSSTLNGPASAISSPPRCSCAASPTARRISSRRSSPRPTASCRR
jgi:cytoskeletal protein RodZ